MSESLRRPGVAIHAAEAATVLGGASLPLLDFRLAGGTALAWHLGHRISDDLDFFTFSAPDLAAAGALATSISAVTDEGSLSFAERTLRLRVGGCHVSFFMIRGRWIDPQQLVSEGFALASVREIAAMKMIAVMTRCTKKDFFDLVTIADTGMSFREIVSYGCEMYGDFREGLPHLRRALVYFDEAEVGPDPKMLVPRTWQSVKRDIARLAREI